MFSLHGTLLIGCLAVIILMGSAHADTPCDFKGISVGNYMTPAEVMKVLGVKEYKINPQRQSFDERKPLSDKYGMIPALEIEEWNIGPYCDKDHCHVPFGITVGDDDTPVEVDVSFHDGQVKSIDVSFNETYWANILPILDQKYGPEWDVERDPIMIVDIETKKSTKFERITLTHKINGTNARTGDRCEIWGTNFDIVFQHHDPVGLYHSTLEIKLISKNF